jgi:molybdopterin-guanine dinucleotide biosynthesis protein A
MLIGSLILAGGRSQRMGRPKESLVLGGDSLLGHVVAALEQTTWPVLVLARDPRQELPPLPVEIEVGYDPEPDRGPLAAIEHGLRALEGRCDWAVVTACDMPFLGTELAGWLAGFAEGHDLVLPQVGGELQTMAGLWRVGIRPIVERLRAGGATAPRDVVPHLRARIVGEAEVDRFDPTRRFLFSVDTPQAYEQAKSWIAH